MQSIGRVAALLILATTGLVAGTELCFAQAMTCIEDRNTARDNHSQLFPDDDELQLTADKAERLVIDVAKKVGLTRGLDVVPCSYVSKMLSVFPMARRFLKASTCFLIRRGSVR